MFVADFIGRAGRGSDGFKVAGLPCMVERRECDFFFRRYAVHADKEGESLFSFAKYPRGRWRPSIVFLTTHGRRLFPVSLYTVP